MSEIDNTEAAVMRALGLRGRRKNRARQCFQKSLGIHRQIRHRDQQEREEKNKRC